MQKRFSELSQAVSSYHEEEVHIHLSAGRKNANRSPKDLSLSQDTSFLKDSQFATTSELAMR